MKSTLTILKKEFKTYFDSPIAYVFMTIFLTVMGIIFIPAFFRMKYSSLRYFFNLLPWFFLFFIPAVTMRLWAEERRSGTIEFLMTLPIKDIEIVLGKFFAALLFIILTLLLTVPYIITVNYLGSPDNGEIFCGYAGAILMGAAYLSIGLFISSITKNQIIAFIISISITFIFFIIGQPFFLNLMPTSMLPFFRWLGLNTHFESIGRGVIDSRDILYYLSVIMIFLYLNVISLSFRK